MGLEGSTEHSTIIRMGPYVLLSSRVINIEGGAADIRFELESTFALKSKRLLPCHCLCSVPFWLLRHLLNPQQQPWRQDRSPYD